MNVHILFVDGAVCSVWLSKASANKTKDYLERDSSLKGRVRIDEYPVLNGEQT